MTFNTILETTGSVTQICLSGELNAATAPVFKEQLEKAALMNPKHLVLLMRDLQYMASAGLRMLIFAKQKMGVDVVIYLIKPQAMVMDTIEKTGFHHSVIIMDEYDATKIETL
ncbi:MAG: anti-sigma factor antagonist [Symploca sp. SIO3C6]|uniref:Anti-sigma factor antagonist n=1 Tax=Symploca sp. SIO1C4 TaxID=2607765 RepID=A0A6B3NHL2_9CYAN|nr:anti-sigma factor antagonist [Symploca sp. SIO3C6]NER29131.1 anti-sigma factor antagonist [Symploca sp. SIO1C4]NET07651.1 anti-sigma factor antagonist [Symploca sp. SIO2B6]